MPITEEDKLSDKYMAGVSCPNCHDKLTPEQIERFSERQKQIRLAKERNERHIGRKLPPKPKKAKADDNQAA